MRTKSQKDRIASAWLHNYNKSLQEAENKRVANLEREFFPKKKQTKYVEDVLSRKKN